LQSALLGAVSSKLSGGTTMGHAALGEGYLSAGGALTPVVTEEVVVVA
jgi:hypothetical protein